MNYDEIFDPMDKMDSIQLMFAISATLWWKVHHMDVKNEYLHGNLKVEIMQ